MDNTGFWIFLITTCLFPGRLLCFILAPDSMIVMVMRHWVICVQKKDMIDFSV